MKTGFTVSTQSQAVSVLVQGSVDTSLSSQKNSFTEMGQCVDTLPSGVDTFWLKLKNVWSRSAPVLSRCAQVLVSRRTHKWFVE
ncbi:hypothetical protein Taro_013348 [Colocasia esculenta]|uniref:Uncharacterized protein n=1 Tax=Colocasia esculenta TaxID=4460 RepID=A0A843UFP6_COLES|nr:hypothetical protein [Colocasia esculenta]